MITCVRAIMFCCPGLSVSTARDQPHPHFYLIKRIHHARNIENWPRPYLSSRTRKVWRRFGSANSIWLQVRYIIPQQSDTVYSHCFVYYVATGNNHRQILYHPTTSNQSYQTCLLCISPSKTSHLFASFSSFS